MSNATATIRELMERRQTAIANKDWATYQRLTTEIANQPSPLTGVPALTKRDIERWNRRHTR